MAQIGKSLPPAKAHRAAPRGHVLRPVLPAPFTAPSHYSPPRSAKALLIIEDTDTHVELEHVEIQIDRAPGLGPYTYADETITIRATVGSGRISPGNVTWDLDLMRQRYAADPVLEDFINAYEDLRIAASKKGVK